jgi:glutamate-1-semialdehyde 2,1-aminomutase
MVFSRIFGKGQQSGSRPAATPEEPDEQDVEAGADPDAAAPEDDVPGYAARAARVVVGGASTGSKRPDRLYGDREGERSGPSHFVRAAGCHLVTSDGDTLVDCTMALGSVALGYAEPELTRAVIETIANGTATGLSPALEVEVAERFCGMVPCAERVLFTKTGAEAMSAAVRIARTYTGRERVIGAGYFGWHDWSSDGEGVPQATRALFQSVPFNDVAAIEAAASAAGDQLAAIVLEPVVERLPSAEWVQRARELCDRYHAVLVFDEMKTGFRIATAGYQQYAEMTPDLAVFGKALANGFPLAAVCGRADLMDVAAHRTWISSTLGSETGALAAAGAVLSWHDRADICASLWSIGKDMRAAVQTALDASGVSGVRLDGLDPMWLLRFQDAAAESAFLAAAVRNGVLFKRGAYNFAAMAHDDDALREIESGASAAFVELREQEAQ